MRYTLTILIIISGQLINAQNHKWYDKYLPEDYNPDLYLLTDSSLTKYYNDTIKDFEIKITGNRDAVFTDWINSINSDIKVEKLKDSKSNCYKEKIFYANGNYEKGISDSYFKGHYRKGIWMLYNRNSVLIGYGEYKRFIILRQYIDLIGENKEYDLRHGRWIYLDAKGQKQKIEYYNKGKLIRTKNIMATNNLGIKALLSHKKRQ